MKPRQFYVYIMTDKYDDARYIGMTNDLARRVVGAGKGGLKAH